MAWQFVGFMTHDTTHGPLPRKRWVKRIGEPRYRMHRKHSTRVAKARRAGKAAYEDTAREYCRWLAARDGIALPSDFRGTIVWSATGKHIIGVSFRDVHVWIPNHDWEPREPVEEMVTMPGDVLVDWVAMALAA